MSKVFGFVGLECYDLVYYTACLAKRLGKNALMVDMSHDHGLQYLYHGDIHAGEFADVDGVGLTMAPLRRGAFAGYDFVMIYFGNNSTNLSLCNELYFVTDFQQNNIVHLKDIKVPDVPRYLVVRYSGACSLNTQFIINEVPNLALRESDVYMLDDTDTDVAARTYLQYSVKMKFTWLSGSIRDLVEHMLDTDFSKKELDKAWKSLRKG